MQHPPRSNYQPTVPLAAVLALALVTGCGASGDPQPLFTVSGRVLDEAGHGLPGAVVTDGQASALSDEAGRYTLGMFAKALTVTKPGFLAAHAAIEAGDTPVSRLTAHPEDTQVGLDTRISSHFSGLRSALSTAATVKDYPATPLANLDVLVLVTPTGVSISERQALARWVHAGGRLVMAGEWGGYPNQDLEFMNALASPAGITFTGATVKGIDAATQAPVWDSKSAIASASLAKLAAVGAPTDQVYLYSTGALALAAPARAVLQSDPKAYSVLGDSSNRQGTQTLAAVGATGAGKVFALADSSLWSDEDSDGDGTPNIQRGANARLAGALVKW